MKLVDTPSRGKNGYTKAHAAYTAEPLSSSKYMNDRAREIYLPGDDHTISACIHLWYYKN